MERLLRTARARVSERRTVNASTAPASATSEVSHRRVGAAIVVGTALEYFDFFLYSAMAALVIGPTFFPSDNSVASSMAALATFGVGFLARPFSGLVFGVIGDKFGHPSQRGADACVERPCSPGASS